MVIGDPLSKGSDNAALSLLRLRVALNCWHSQVSMRPPAGSPCSRPPGETIAHH